MVTREESGNEVKVRRATKSVGSVGVDTTRRTRRGGNQGGVGGVLPAVSLQTEKKEFIIKIADCLQINDFIRKQFIYFYIKQ